MDLRLAEMERRMGAAEMTLAASSVGAPSSVTGAHGRHAQAVDEGWTPRLEIKGWMRDYDQLTTLGLMQPELTHAHTPKLCSRPGAGKRAGRLTPQRPV